MERLPLRRAYHPFFHEVAAAVTDPTLGDAVRVEVELWPGLRFGDLLFARAGVRLRVGPGAALDPAVATASTLHFACERLHRPTADLSHGWGSNSRWRTRFRRDYLDDATLRYNVDGRTRLTRDAVVPPPDDPLPPDDHLTPAERVEVLTHRCRVGAAGPDDDLWPFGDTAEDTADGTGNG